MKHNLNGDTLTVELEGELDQYSSASFRNELEELLQNEKIRHLNLDLRHLRFMDSSGIGVVLGRYKTLSRRSGDVTVLHPTDRVDRIFRMSGIYQLINKQP